MVLKMPFWWSLVVIVALVTGLAGCDSPSPAFSGLASRNVTVDGSSFSVRHTRDRAEAIRLSREWRPPLGRTLLKGSMAIMLASGCAVKPGSLDGDTNIVRADLDCAGQGALPGRARAEGMDCIGYELGGIGGDGLIDITCETRR